MSLFVNGGASPKIRITNSKNILRGIYKVPVVLYNKLVTLYFIVGLYICTSNRPIWQKCWGLFWGVWFYNILQFVTGLIAWCCRAHQFFKCCKTRERIMLKNAIGSDVVTVWFWLAFRRMYNISLKKKMFDLLSMTVINSGLLNSWLLKIYVDYSWCVDSVDINLS